MRLHRIAPFLTLAVLACTGRDADQRAAAPPANTPAAAPAPAPAPAPSAMTNPDDIAHATFDASLGVNLAGMRHLPNGLYYKDIKAGTGHTATDGDMVWLHYVGRLPTGTQFDANQAPAEPFSFQLMAGQVVPGFDFGVKGMKPGGRRLVIIPPSLGYGARANGPLPAFAILVFTIDLVNAHGR